MPITSDEPRWHMAVECDGKASHLGCMIAQSTEGKDKDACMARLKGLDWVLGENGVVLCRLCFRRMPNV